MVVHACNSSRDWEADYIVRSCVKLKKKKKRVLLFQMQESHMDIECH
jgi:hypothetical protein